MADQLSPLIQCKLLQPNTRGLTLATYHCNIILLYVTPMGILCNAGTSEGRGNGEAAPEGDPWH